MLKYLLKPVTPTLFKSGLNIVIGVNKKSFGDSNFSKFAQKNKIENEGKKNISQENLKQALRKEERDHEAASKLESLEEQLLAEESKNLNIDNINLDASIFNLKEKVENVKGSSIEIFKNKFGVNVDNFIGSLITQYNQLDYMKDISPLIEKLKSNGFNDFNIKVIIQKDHKFLVNPDLTEKLILNKPHLKNLLPFLTEFELCETLACIPNIVALQSTNIENNINNIKSFLRLDNDNELKSLILEYPILISNLSSDLTKIEFYFKLYLDMSKDEVHSFAKKFPLIMIATPDNVLNIFKTVDRMKFDRKEWRAIIERNPKVFLFRHTQITNVVSLLREQGIKAKEVFEFIKEYPDLLLSNRHELLKHKLNLFRDLKMNKDTIKNLIKKYPFILLKSYNSFIYKVFYFSKELKRDIEDSDIYPLIYLYNLNKDIKPRCELMKKYNKWIPFNEAFSMTLEELASKLDVKLEEAEKIDGGPLYERDLMFRYSKYKTI